MTDALGHLLKHSPLAFLVPSLLATRLVGHDWGIELHFGIKLLAVVFIVIPIVDRLVGSHRSRRPELGGLRRTVSDGGFLLVLVRGPILMMFIVLGAVAVAADRPLGGVVLAGVAIGVLSAALGILIAHELSHRQSRLAWHSAELVMTVVLYPHWCVEHVFGHHRRVGTTEDPATARRGENVFSFFRRSVVGGLRSFIEIERRRRERLHISLYSWRNRAVRYPLMVGTLLCVVWVVGGPYGLVVFTVQVVTAIFLLESINYIEHYGLIRAPGEGGGVERVGPQHSWDSAHLVSNLLLFNVGRHSDHHVSSRTAYQDLGATSSAPQLPFGYPTMLVMAWIPPLWFRTME